ncbi:MAG: hypothetical protein AB8F78_18990 [Saprospiraceae bacterium]
MLSNAFFIGTSCCWLTSLALWVGGAAAIGTLASIIEDAQGVLIGVGSTLLLLSMFLYLKHKKRTT